MKLFAVWSCGGCEDADLDVVFGNGVTSIKEGESVKVTGNALVSDS